MASAAPIRSKTDPVSEKVRCVPPVSTPDQMSLPVDTCCASTQHGALTDTTTVYRVDETGTVASYEVTAVGTTVLSVEPAPWLRERWSGRWLVVAVCPALEDAGAGRFVAAARWVPVPS